MFAFVKKAAVNLAAGYAKENVKVDSITTLVARQTSSMLAKMVEGKDAETLKRVANACSKTARVCDKIATAIADGKITTEEAQQVIGSIFEAFDASPITDETIGAAIDSLAKNIIARIH